MVQESVDVVVLRWVLGEADSERGGGCSCLESEVIEAVSGRRREVTGEVNIISG